jgi:hypothetical protein
VINPNCRILRYLRICILNNNAEVGLYRRTLFKKAKYEKCIEKTKKYLSKEKKSPDLQYYIVQPNFALYRRAEEKKRLSFLRKTISNWERLEKYNTAHIDYSILGNELIESIENELSNTSFKKLRKTNYYHQKLAEVFHDILAP